RGSAPPGVVDAGSAGGAAAGRPAAVERVSGPPSWQAPSAAMTAAPTTTSLEARQSRSLMEQGYRPASHGGWQSEPPAGGRNRSELLAVVAPDDAAGLGLAGRVLRGEAGARLLAALV